MGITPSQESQPCPCLAYVYVHIFIIGVIHIVRLRQTNIGRVVASLHTVEDGENQLTLLTRMRQYQADNNVTWKQGKTAVFTWLDRNSKSLVSNPRIPVAVKTQIKPKPTLSSTPHPSLRIHRKMRTRILLNYVEVDVNLANWFISSKPHFEGNEIFFPCPVPHCALKRMWEHLATSRLPAFCFIEISPGKSFPSFGVVFNFSTGSHNFTRFFSNLMPMPMTQKAFAPTTVSSFQWLPGLLWMCDKICQSICRCQTTPWNYSSKSFGYPASSDPI